MSNQSDALDILWGVESIAKAIGRTTTATYHLLEKGNIPAAKKVGGRWCASVRRLRDMFEAVAA